jgi:prefoldin beta subunit
LNPWKKEKFEKDGEERKTGVNMADKKEAEELSRALAEYESLEKQLEVILLQKNQIKVQLGETKKALEELKHAKGEVYRSVGSLMIKTTKEEAEKDLEDKRELMEVKQKALEKEEDKLRDVVGGLQKKLQEQMKEYAKHKK